MTDPILARRGQISRMAKLGQRIGYSLYAIAIVGFVIGFTTDFADWLANLVIVALIVGSILLAPAIVAGYAVKAADREDREMGR